jgi:hypothetical protein
MKYIKEITDWSDSKVAVPNHTYIVNDAGHLLGYIKTKTKEEIRFKSPMKQFSKSRRKFITLKDFPGQQF